MLIPNSVRLILAERGRRTEYYADVALSAVDALEVLRLLAGARVFVFGGNVVRLTAEGWEYVKWDFWRTSRKEGENVEDYRERGLREAAAYIERYRAKHGDEPWYTVCIGEGVDQYGR